jgi:hypothetical protein
MPDPNHPGAAMTPPQLAAPAELSVPPAEIKAGQEIRFDKYLRRDLDESLQTLKRSPASRERALAITKLQEAIMWLGMDLKRLGDLVGTTPNDPLDRARAAYQRYGEVTGFKNFRGEPMPKFGDLGERIRAAWVAAAGPALGGPYPSSYDPAIPTVEPTADGLKL